MEHVTLKKIGVYLLLLVMILLLGAGFLMLTGVFKLPGQAGTGSGAGEVLKELNQPSPDGEFTVGVSAEDPGMHGSAITLSREGAKDVTVLAAGDADSWVTNPIWSPDGQTIAYLRVRNLQPAEFEIDTKVELWVYHLASGENRLVTDSAALNPSISFDGTADIKWVSDTLIQYPNNEAFPIQYYTVDINTGETTAEVSKGLPKTADAASLPGEVPYFSQCDSRWGNLVLGTCSEFSICEQGCAISSAAMVLQYFGVDMDPSTINNWLKANNGYVSGCLINWAVVANIAPSKLTWVARVDSQDWARLRYELDKGYPVILEVRINGGQHFVVATGYSGNIYYINDPYYPSRKTLDSYGNSFVGLRVYHGPTSEPASCPAPTDTQTYVCTPELTPAYNDKPCSSLWYPVPGYNGYYNYLVENTASEDTSTNQGTWTPSLPVAGKYKVEAFIAAHGTFSKTCSWGTMTFGADSSKANYAITDKDGIVTQVVRDQLPLNDEWLNLGEYSFDTGGKGFITLTDLTGEAESSRNLSLGAMRFTLVSEETLLPAITSLSHTIRAAGQNGLTLTVTGINFSPQSVVRWNGSDRSTTYVNETTLKAAIPGEDIALAGNFEVTVFNPEPGGGLSTPALFSVISIVPARNEKLTASKVSFDWDDIPNADFYNIQISAFRDFSQLLYDTSTVESRYTHFEYLRYSTNYWWRVRVKNDGYWGPWSPAWKFRSMDPLAAPVLLAPGHRLRVNNSVVDLVWEPVVNGPTYIIQVAKDANFLLMQKSETLAVSSVSYTLDNGRYFWRVRAVDASGRKGPWSEVRIFKVYAAP